MHSGGKRSRGHKVTQLERLRRRITSLDGASIDQLYGLEPVWEPGQGPAGLVADAFVAVLCPWCGERLETRVDLTGDEPGYVEDCEVCCRPVEFRIERDAGGALVALQVRRMD
jgi:cysteine-rich CPXCG protein